MTETCLLKDCYDGTPLPAVPRVRVKAILGDVKVEG
jgi:hypothetical protein